MIDIIIKKADALCPDLRGTYEEMYSNWKNKMTEAACRDDVYSSFMNLLSLQWMFYEIAEYEKVGIYPKHFGSMTEFADDYNKEISEEI